ncbi:MAG: cytidylate kinase-like family protein [bacterium]|nr:cytidylate kinase-like family protein [bacterium]
MDRFVIAVTRTCGSGGTTISKMLAEKFEIDLYDRKLLRLASQDSGINEELFARADENTRKSLLYNVEKKVYHGEIIPPESNDFVSDQNLFNYQAKVLKELARQESYICVGRACDYVLREFSNVLRVFVYAPEAVCFIREAERQGISINEAKRYVRMNDRYRRRYYRYHTSNEWENPYNYDVCINTGNITYEESVSIISRLVEEKFCIKNVV